jgi:hypothetical protein
VGLSSSVIPFRHLVTGLQLQKMPGMRFLESAPKEFHYGLRQATLPET